MSGATPQQNANQSSASGTNGVASNTNVGNCGCNSGDQHATNNVSNTTTQTIVQVAPSTAIATAINYGSGSASATAVAAPTQNASQTANTKVDDPANNVGNGDQYANNDTSNTTNQNIDQYAPTNATATATSYNGHASATAIAAPTQIASQFANTSASGSSHNVGLGCGCGEQDAHNTSTNTTTQSIHQDAPTTATATATSGSEWCSCGGGSNNNATAIAIAKPVQIASQSSTDKVYGSANNIGLGSGDQTAINTTTNTTDQNIHQDAPANATATATNDAFGFGNQQSATAVAIAQPSQIAVQGALNIVTGSANNYALGFGCECLFSDHGSQTAINTTTNETDQDITQNGHSDATATATNDAFGFGNHQYATAIAVAAPKQSASELSAAYVSGIATNVGLGGNTDQFAFNVTTNSGDDTQTIDQHAKSDATADAENSVIGFGNSQRAQATAIADPTQSASERMGFKVTGQAINTDLSSGCSCDSFGYRSQDAENQTYSNNQDNQNITQNAPATVEADAYNNGFGFGLGMWNTNTWQGCGCGQNTWGSFGTNNIQNATAVAAAAPVQRASEAMLVNASGQATNINLSASGPSYQGHENDYGNYVYTGPSQDITQNAGADVTADAENNPSIYCLDICDSLGFGSSSDNVQNATAIATSAPVQTANEVMLDSVSGSAVNIFTGASHSCGCDQWGNDNVQYADNYVESDPSQEITQRAPSDVTAYAYNYPSDSIIWDECGCGSQHGLGSVQNATAIAAAQPIQSASQVYLGNVSGQALNTWLGTSCSCEGFNWGTQDANNDTENYPSQEITQNASLDGNDYGVTADAENWGFGFGGHQQAFAVAVAAPRQLASQFESDKVVGTATNVSLGASSPDQYADNTTYNGESDGGYQTIHQDAPSYVEADAYNYPSLIWVPGDVCGGCGFAGSQNATAIAGAAPVQTASQYQANGVYGSATNLNVGGRCGCDFWNSTYQDAYNTTDNEVNQNIHQDAPAYVYADAENVGLPFFWGCDFGCFGGQQNATAIATAASVQHANQTSLVGLRGQATNVNLSHNCSCGCWWCGSSDQYASNESNNSVDQDLTQHGATDSEAYAYNYPEYFFPWGGNSGCGCGTGSFGQPALASFRANVGNGSTFSAPSLSTPAVLSGLSLNGLGGNWGSSNINLAGDQGLGIKLGLSISNSESLNLPTISQLLHGVSLFGLLHGVVALSLNLSVTTPWVQVATAVAHETPFSVLFSVSQQQGFGPWNGFLL
ncbi:MAG: hypothetical protein IVW57_01750 [Ktedonobacterales bacterium]|nr:hypothetical protein [Ktedonobacterales bacterium]